MTERQRQCDGERSQEAKQLTASLPLLSLVPPGFSCLSLAAPYQGPLVHCSCFAGHCAELMPRGIEKISASKPSMDRDWRENHSSAGPSRRPTGRNPPAWNYLEAPYSLSPGLLETDRTLKPGSLICPRSVCKDSRW